MKRNSNKLLWLAIAFLQLGLLFGQTGGPKSVTICWDSSLSMKDRQIEKEFNWLQQYFDANQEARVEVLLFSNAVVDKKEFEVSRGHWGLVKEYLQGVTYDGGTSYSALSNFGLSGDVLLFTDGHQNTNIGSPFFQGNLYVISSRTDFDQANLNLLAILNKGSLVNLSRESKNSNETETYFGKLQGVASESYGITLGLKGRNDFAVRPAPDGSYEIKASEGDVLVVTTSTGKKIEKNLGQNRNIDIWLGGGDEITLEEVVVTGESAEPVNEKVTAFGNKNEDAVGYAVQSITDEQISPISTTVNNAAQGKFSGVSLGQNDDLSQVKMRPSNSILGSNYGLIVVDGVPLPRSDSSASALGSSGGQSNDTSRSSAIQSTDFLDPQNIANITVLKGLAATNRFGSMGSNGVIMITTKTGSQRQGGPKVDLALRTDNVYEGKLNVSAKTLVTPYLKALKKAKNLQQAYEIYLVQREQYQAEPAFYIDVFDYFINSSEGLALRVLTNVLEDDSLGYGTLRAMLLKCQEHGLNRLELETADKILERFPDKIQSYFDLAMAYKNNAQYQSSLVQLLKTADGSVNNELDFSGLKKSIDAEIKNLVYMHGRELDLSALDADYRKNLNYNARVIFDWNHPASEFELQFVNPQKRFFTWEHNSIVNDARLEQEWEQGFSREEFEIVGQDVPGEWLINVKYLGNANSADQSPTFLRCIVQHNFGKPGQTEEVYTIRLYEKNSEDQFVKLNIN